MNFDMSKPVAVPFSLTEDEIKKNFLDWVIIGENTPIDIAFESNITKINKVFYPIRIDNADYATYWKAKSIWEHKEEYYDTQRVELWRDMNNGQVRRKRVSKMFPNPTPPTPHHTFIGYDEEQVKRTRTVTDNIENTNGIFNGNLTKKVVTVENNDNNLIEWIGNLPIDENQFKIAADFSEITVMPLIEDDEYVKAIVNDEIIEKADDECESQVPGTRYEDFNVYDVKASHNISVILLPVYEVNYDYWGTSYKVLFSGTEADNAFSDKKPTSAYLAKKNNELKSQLDTKEKEASKNKTQDFWILVVIAIIEYYPATYSFFSVWDSGKLWWLLLSIIIFDILVIRNMIKKSKEYKTEIENLKKQLDSHISGLDEKRKKIAEIVKQDNLTAEEQKAKIKEIIEKT